jgi:hypothetical protein
MPCLQKCVASLDTPSKPDVDLINARLEYVTNLERGGGDE